MKISNILTNITQYITEAFARIFGATEETPPDIGVQPYDCALYTEKHANSES